MPRKKKAPTHGGSRPGCGAKIKGTAPRVKISFTLDPENLAFLQEVSEELGMSRSDYLNWLIEEKM
jgi:hypothetical protein